MRVALLVATALGPLTPASARQQATAGPTCAEALSETGLPIVDGGVDDA
jgi:hypothetical protein